MEYKVIPGPTAIRGSSRKALEQRAGVYADLINYEATNGWNFVCFDSTSPQLEALLNSRLLSEEDLQDAIRSYLSGQKAR